MLATAVSFMVLASLGGIALLASGDTMPRRALVRGMHAALGVLALVWIFAGAHDAGIAGQGPLVGLLGFATASGGLLFRQRIRDHLTTRPARWVHAGLGLAGLALLLWITLH
ncbi:MAG: hypothetical protein CMP06_14465 [Xanthomonadales bacterium]|nr:hypothetical protein [Xanthomonadales bacterium]